jgi:sigma-B regulation protein RsbQ
MPDPHGAPTTRVLERNNVHLSGNPAGPSIVFAHGFGCDQHMWRLMTPQFESEFHVVVFDHVGFGASDRASWDVTRHADLQTYATELLEVLHELALGPVTFVGHSVASMIGVLASAEDPAAFAHLVLVGPSPRYIDDPLNGYVGGFSAADIDELLESLESNYLGWSSVMAPIMMANPDRPALGNELTESFCRTDPRIADTFARATFLSDNRADLARVVTATLILQCSEDPIAPEQVGAFVHTTVAGSELVQLAATGHCPNLSAPDETTAEILAYLERHGRTAR